MLRASATRTTFSPYTRSRRVFDGGKRTDRKPITETTRSGKAKTTKIRNRSRPNKGQRKCRERSSPSHTSDDVPSVRNPWTTAIYMVGTPEKSKRLFEKRIEHLMCGIYAPHVSRLNHARVSGRVTITRDCFRFARPVGTDDENIQNRRDLNEITRSDRGNLENSRAKGTTGVCSERVNKFFFPCRRPDINALTRIRRYRGKSAPRPSRSGHGFTVFNSFDSGRVRVRILTVGR